MTMTKKNENKQENDYDIIIIGAGPAGMNSAIYSARYMMKTLVIGELLGGMASKANEVCNFLTYENIRGFELVMKMREQVIKNDVEIVMKHVECVEKINSHFVVKTKDTVYTCKKVILATGTKKRHLNVDNEDRLVGRGVSYCATCDAAFFRDKVVAVAGGSDSALTSALLLADYAKKVYIVYRSGTFYRAEPAWVKLVEKNEKIEPMFNEIITGINGENKVESITLDSGKEIKVDGIFVEIGSTPNTIHCEKLGLKLNDGYIKTNREQRTNVDGIFAAGDVTDNSLKQIIVAASEGAVAANSAYSDIMGERAEKK